MQNWKDQIKDILFENFQVMPSDQTLSEIRSIIASDLHPSWMDLNILQRYSEGAMQAVITKKIPKSTRDYLEIKETLAEEVVKEAFEIAEAMLVEFKRRQAIILNIK